MISKRLPLLVMLNTNRPKKTKARSRPASSYYRRKSISNPSSVKLAQPIDVTVSFARQRQTPRSRSISSSTSISKTSIGITHFDIQLTDTKNKRFRKATVRWDNKTLNVFLTSENEFSLKPGHIKYVNEFIQKNKIAEYLYPDYILPWLAVVNEFVSKRGYLSQQIQNTLSIYFSIVAEICCRGNPIKPEDVMSVQDLDLSTAFWLAELPSNSFSIFLLLFPFYNIKTPI